MAEREAAAERRALESRQEAERLGSLVHNFDSERQEMVEAAIQQRNIGEEAGNQRGWNAALRTLVESNIITQAVADDVDCPYTISVEDSEVMTQMETEGEVDPTGDKVTDEEAA